jgi:branched-chain amino acid transport system permease protein
MRRADLPISFLSIAAATCVAIAAGTFLSEYWCFLGTTMAITAIVLQSFGFISGRAGMISLCQLSFAAIGAWTTGWLNVMGAPGGLAVYVLLGGLCAVPFGIAIGIPALRLRGIRFAILTLAFAAAVDLALMIYTFPGQTENIAVARPELIDSDRGYFLFVVMVWAVLAIMLELLGITRFGIGLVALKHSERAAASQGVNVPLAKITAFALSSFIAAVAGGLLAGQLGTLVPNNFGVMQSLAFFSVAVMFGARYSEGAIAGSAMVALLPEVFRRMQIPQDMGDILFAVGAIQALASGSSIGAQLHERLRWPAVRGQITERTNRSPRPLQALPNNNQELQVTSLTVRYGAIVAVDQVSFCIPPRTIVGLIGPNGAGKSTLIDAISGFLPHYEGTILMSGQPIDPLPAYKRAHGIIRRSWQTNRIAPDMTVGDHIRLAAPSLDTGSIEELLGWFGCPPPQTQIKSMDAGSRRMLDVAGAVGASAGLVLLDEPAAGQSAEDSERLGEKIREIPSRFGLSVLLVEHDIDLVRAVCSQLVVLDFGKLVTLGDPNTVLDSEAVKRAYLGSVSTGESI